ncbi:hypothetical protein OH76DRAFT_1410374 [Lentinus brumalis]|uniref:Uncharacterized protein n=1 Tax=Lentinus brumalis TaxID=2498619 RepID=A0A371CSC8_9APHY|nr:hypothetical protein OH76DRAFT_1410374 [Polyporus brumalis]
MYCYFTNRDVSPRHRTFPVVTARTGPPSSAPRIRTFRKCGKGEGDPHQRGRAALGVYTACSLPRHRAICSLVPDTIYQPYGVCWGNFADPRVMWRWSQENAAFLELALSLPTCLRRWRAERSLSVLSAEVSTVARPPRQLTACSRQHSE